MKVHSISSTRGPGISKERVIWFQMNDSESEDFYPCDIHSQTLKTFLPSILENNHGHIVTIASSAGIFPVNGLVDYCSSKFAAVGLHQSLELELQLQNKSGVKTTLVCPYLVKTGMFAGAGGR